MANCSIHVSENVTILLHDDRLAVINLQATLQTLGIEPMIFYADHIQLRESGKNLSKICGDLDEQHLSRGN